MTEERNDFHRGIVCPLTVIRTPGRRVLRICVYVGVLPFLACYLYISSVIQSRDIVSARIVDDGNDTTMFVLLTRDAMLVRFSAGSPSLTVDDQKSSLHSVPVARFHGLDWRMSSSGPMWLVGEHEHEFDKKALNKIYDYQSGSSLLTSPHGYNSFSMEATLEGNKMCLGKAYCKDLPTSSISSFSDAQPAQTFAQTNLFEGEYYSSNQTMTGETLRIYRPGIFSLLLPPSLKVFGGIGAASLSSSSNADVISSSLPFRRNPNKEQHHDDGPPSPLWILLGRPALVLLMGLQIGLAFVYWNYKVAPSVVAKEYTYLKENGHQAWRILSGATAHFDLWHLGLNMSAFYNLSLHLEGEPLYSSLEYLGMNLSLVVIVGTAWFGLQHRFVRPEQRGPTVGYSGVLFALSVISTLHLPPGTQTCPVPFLDQMCFSNIALGGGVSIFSWSPWLQLVVAQVLLPRVSWTGHLAGVLVGFAYMWGLVPFLAFPSIYWQLLHLLYLRYICGIEGKQKVRFASLSFCVHAVTLLASITFSGGLLGASNISFALWFLFDCYVEACERHESVLRGYVVATVLNLISCSITSATRIALLGLPFSKQPLTDLTQWWLWLLNLDGLLRAIQWWTNSHNNNSAVGGIFGLLLGTILFSSEHDRNCALSLPFTQQQQPTSSSTNLAASSSPALFPGTGRTLGGGSNSGKQRPRVV